MSFILDALKKSETERQQKSSAEFAKVPTGSGPTRAPGWLLILGVLLAVNLIVLLGLLLRPSSEPPVLSAPAVSEASVARAVETRQPGPAAAAADDGPPSFADRVAEAKQATPATAPARAAVQEDGIKQAAPPAVPVDSSRPANTSTLPTIYEVITDGSIVLPELHLDIHVYSDVPQDRFVFINMSKQRERSQLEEGPVVDEITPDGVILTYRGETFLLPRD
ncbi:MAG: general secretion pathway protein GspB [Woeseiaceae bacterium]